MTKNLESKNDGPVGTGVVLSRPSPNVVFKTYLADRPSPIGRSWGAEIAFDVTITLPHPRRKVWEAFKDFNTWMSRFGYEWEGLPGGTEDSFVYLRNRPGANDLKWPDGLRVKYIVRKVIPEQLIYFDSPPNPIIGKDGAWTGHNVMTLHEERGHTTISVFIEHTWYSDTMSLEELRTEAKNIIDGGVVFWRDYFIPDLTSAIESSVRPPA